MEYRADGAVSKLVIRWDAIRELQIIQPGCNEEYKADRNVKEAEKMNTNSKKKKCLHGDKEVGPHPVEKL